LSIRLLDRLRGHRFKHELGICAIFREEAPFFDEWITFHLGVGVTHFYLYNNFSTDDFRAVLAPWIARGTVTLIEWPVPAGQEPAYRHCVRQVRGECRWVAFIDLDEFLFSPQVQDIRPILREYADLPGVEVWQATYGSNGHLRRPDLPVTEAYLRRAPLRRTTVKTIANPRLTYKIGIHQFSYWLGRGLDTSRQVVVRGREPVLDRLRINHYWSRSLEDLDMKIARGRPESLVPRQRDLHYHSERSYNAEYDDTILPVARAIRAAAEQRPGR
jgi:hypothetical protein